MKNNKFRAPQKRLQSSWVETPFTKSKTTGPIIKRSLGSRPNAIIKDRGQVVGTSGGQSNVY